MINKNQIEFDPLKSKSLIEDKLNNVSTTTTLLTTKSIDLMQRIFTLISDKNDVKPNLLASLDKGNRSKNNIKKVYINGIRLRVINKKVNQKLNLKLISPAKAAAIQTATNANNSNLLGNNTQTNNIVSYKDNIYEYIKSLTPYLPNLRKRGISLNNIQNNSYFFSKNNNYKIINNQVNGLTPTNIKNTYKLLKYFFKSLYCIISKPVFYVSGDKVIIKLFYFLNIPRRKVYLTFINFYMKEAKNKIINYINWMNNKKKVTGNKANLSGIYLNKKSAYIKSDKAKLAIKNLNIKNRKFKFKYRFIKSVLKLRRRIIKSIKLTNNKFKLLKNTNLLKFRQENQIKLLSLFTNNLNKVYQNKFIIICNILSKLFNRPVELHLTRLHQPYNNSNILVNLLAMNLKNKKKKSRVLIYKIYNKNPIRRLKKSLFNLSNMKYFVKENKNGENIIDNLKPNAFISGLNIKIAGRLMREPIIPRITTKNFERGARATGKVNLLDTASLTSKNKKGAFTIKIVTGQNFYV